MGMDIMIILLILLGFWLYSKWERYDVERRYKKHKEEQKKRGLYYDRNKSDTK